MKPFFSIIIPTLNEEHFLPKLLIDLTRQKEKDFEVIVVDGSSQDKTKERALRFKKLLQLKVFTVSKRSTSYQKNFGAARARGNYLVFLDADTRVPVRFLQTLMKETRENKYLILMPALKPQGGSYSDKLLFNFYNFLVEISQNMPKPFITPGAMIFQKDFFLFIGKFTERGRQHKDTLYPEDHKIILKAAESGIKAKFLSKLKVGFSLRRMHAEGRLTVINKYIISAIEMVTKGKLDSSLRYEMGGHVYKKSGLTRDQLEKILTQAKKS